MFFCAQQVKIKKTRDLMTNLLFFLQRKERDSNPRNSYPFTAFRVRPVRPLRHLSFMNTLQIQDMFSKYTRKRRKKSSLLGMPQGVLLISCHKYNFQGTARMISVRQNAVGIGLTSFVVYCCLVCFITKKQQRMYMTLPVKHPKRMPTRMSEQQCTPR